MALSGNIRVPSDKSISHRAVLFSGMARGTSHLTNLLPSDDVLSSLAAIRTFGAKTELSDGPHGLCGTVTGFGSQPSCEGVASIDCGNSGTTTRLLLGLISGLGVSAVLHGDDSLSKRPMERVMKPLRAMGARFESQDGTLPVKVCEGAALEAIEYTTEQASAQVKSAILLAGLNACGKTVVHEPAASRDHTERLLPAFGVEVEVDGLTSSVTGPAKLTAHDMDVPGDPSSASFIAVAAAILPGSDVVIEQVALNPTRTGAFEVLRRMGCELSYENERTEGAEPVGDVRVRFSPALRGTVVEPDEIPTLVDEVPVLALAAAFASGETVFRAAGELRVKESDRFSAVLELMSALGVEAFGDGDDLHIVGCSGAVPNAGSSFSLSTFHDHRLAMTYYLAGLVFGCDVNVDDPDCASVSWPSFYDDIAKLLA